MRCATVRHPAQQYSSAESASGSPQWAHAPEAALDNIVCTAADIVGGARLHASGQLLREPTAVLASAPARATSQSVRRRADSARATQERLRPAHGTGRAHRSCAMMTAWMALGAGALAGGLSIPHCVAMCGPLAAFAAGEKGSWRRIARYQLGRLGSYVALGIAAGSSGGALASLVAPRWAAIALSFFLAAAMVLAAVRLLGPGEARLVQLGRRRPGTPWIARLLARLPREPALVGAVTALLPCGALYSAA